MPDQTLTITDLAGEAYSWFERAERDHENEFGETSYVRLKEGTPDWVRDLVHEAHGDFMPDDWRYEAIRDVLGGIHDHGDDDLEDVDHEICDGLVDTYNANRYRWLASRRLAAWYCDAATSEFGPQEDVTQLIGMGQYMEAREVFASVLDSLVAEFQNRTEDGD